MHEERTDRRVIRTQARLQQALQELILEKRYDKITVQDIIDRADVGRSTFYAHYLDKEDLLASGMRRYGQEFGEHAKAAEHETDQAHLLHSLIFFQHAYDNRDLYRAMLAGGGRRFLLDIGRQHIMAHVEEHLEQRVKQGHRPPVPLDVITHYFAGAMMSLVVWWIDDGMQLPPDEINAMYQAMAGPSVEHLLAG
ncbi:MAG: TetR/AcrR family transcriptional regulator [Actinomycetota bacterium]